MPANQDFVKANYAAINQDEFFKTDYGFEEVYYNPESAAGGQFVRNIYTYSLIHEAVNTGSVEAFFEYLNDNCMQHSIDIDSEDFVPDRLSSQVQQKSLVRCIVI